MRNITISEAVVSTVTVDIQVIRIGSKQMTLAVFRQLQRLAIFDVDGCLLGDPWGWVNYDNSFERKPFIFSHDGVLYRADVDTNRYPRLTVVACGETRWKIRGFYEGERREITAGSLTIDDFFRSEAEAYDYLANIRKSIAVLESAPQLFIAV